MDQNSEQHGLKRELRLTDLVLLQVLLIVGLGWVGSAAKEGSTHVVLGLAGIVFFYLPLGAVVILLSRAIPVEGGTYQWRRSPGSWWPWRLCPFRLCPLPAWLTGPSLV